MRNPEDEAMQGVPFVPVCCPYCDDYKPFTYAVRKRIRYHRCQSCGRKYKSVQLTAASVTGFSSHPRDGTDPDQ
jgi:transposase-like protein